MAVNVVITPEAEEAFTRLSEDKKADYVRVSAAAACGCGRIGYQMSWETDREQSDEAIDAQGLLLLVDEESRPHLEGGIIDYKRDTMSEGFYISNPNAPAGCGCGGH